MSTFDQGGAPCSCKYHANFTFSPIDGAAEKITTLRYRHQEITESLAQLEARVTENAAELERMRHSYDQEEDDFQVPVAAEPVTTQITDEDLERELEEIRKLEKKKRALEDRVTGMERDLGGLLR
jgi:chromosome segregation ATPase